IITNTEQLPSEPTVESTMGMEEDITVNTKISTVGKITFLDSEFRYTLFPVYVLFVLQLYGEFLCRVTGAFFFINTYCSILFLAVISFNRYWAITRPLDAASSEHWCRGVAVTMVIWVFTLSMSVKYLLKTGIQVDMNNGSRCFEGYHNETDDEKRRVATTHLIIVGCFALVFFLVVVCNLLIAQTLLAQSPTQTRGSSSYIPQGVKGQALQMLCAVVGVFVVCFLPHHVVQAPWTLAVLEGWGRVDWEKRTKQWLNDAHQVTLNLMGLNCLLEPVVYCFATRKFRLYIKDHLKKVGRGKGCSETAITHIYGGVQ
uniref:Platelet activating factor receptor n=1 Tax=Hucho hucho TaxID=62062 RepID=A0A4W5KB07_9TELE